MQPRRVDAQLVLQMVNTLALLTLLALIASVRSRLPWTGDEVPQAVYRAIASSSGSTFGDSLRSDEESAALTNELYRHGLMVRILELQPEDYGPRFGRTGPRKKGLPVLLRNDSPIPVCLARHDVVGAVDLGWKC